MFWLLLGVAAAEPWTDPAVSAAMDCARASGADTLLGDGAWEPWEIAAKLHDTDCPKVLASDGWTPAWTVRPWARVAGGDAVPDGNHGDEEPGLVTAVGGAYGAVVTGPFFVAFEPELEGGVVPGLTLDIHAATLYGGARWRGLSVGFGLRDRWLGPGHHGTLLLSDNARPPWLGTLTVNGRLPGWFDHLGRFRVEAGAGWLSAPRDDVQRPGLLMMDLRWAPAPWIELGATRLSIFGGVGRPPVDVGQLLLPTEPHVYDDPDLTQPDQDELAALDLRLTLPLRRWTNLPIDYLEGWWQYGGEDVIARKLGPIPYPSLAGVGNLYGASLQVRPVTVTGEYTRLLDDYFRWYVGHRVYHDGFTQDGRVMGHFGGPDSETAFGSVAVELSPARARAWGDWVRRVGVIGAQNDKLFTLMTEEHTSRVGLDGGWHTKKGWLTAGYAFEHVTGEGFVPNAVGNHHRVYVGFEGEIGRPE